ncbi:MAG: phosphate signaling complex protein PhoU [Planctomycetota bacterium]
MEDGVTSHKPTNTFQRAAQSSPATPRSGPTPVPISAPPSGSAGADLSATRSAEVNRSASTFDRDLHLLRRRIVRLATSSVDLLEASIRALWDLDTAGAREVRQGEEMIDLEEVAIERECLRLLTLQQPYGLDFRQLTFCLKVNADLERVADHASSIAKVTLKLGDVGVTPRWPTALTDLGERLPVVCHRLLRAMLDDDAEAARGLVGSDEVIDTLDKRLFQELAEHAAKHPSDGAAVLLMHRVGRDLERVGDLMCNIAEDVVYLVTGEIIRHERSGDAARS